MPDQLPLWKRIVKAVLSALLVVVLLSAFYLAVIMGDPQEDADAGVAVNMAQPLLSALPAPVMIQSRSRLGDLLSAFPAPVMAYPNSSRLLFELGVCEDVPFEKGLGRRVTLTYRTPQGLPVAITSIYPARALSLIPKADYTISGIIGNELCSYKSVRMQNATTVRFHAQGEEALYAVTLPVSETDLRSLTSTLQLFQDE